MKIATWNVNSLRVRLPQVLDWLKGHEPDVLCLQETKVTDADFPAETLRAAGYFAAVSGQKTYNGVATLSRRPAEAVELSLPGTDESQKRLLVASIGGVRIVNVYVPNGEAVGSDKFVYKLGWLKALRAHIAGELARHPRLIVLGDFNIAPEARDVHDPASWDGHVLFSEPERAAFRDLTDAGLADTFRMFEQPEQSYTWWDYRRAAFRRNHGLRIDHILGSQALAAACRSCHIDTAPRRHERPSDHAPVIAEFDSVPA